MEVCAAAQLARIGSHVAVEVGFLAIRLQRDCGIDPDGKMAIRRMKPGGVDGQVNGVPVACRRDVDGGVMRVCLDNRLRTAACLDDGGRLEYENRSVLRWHENDPGAV